MKNVFTLWIILLFLGVKSYAQSTPKSILYDLINGNEYGAKLLLDKKGYFLLTNGICDPGTGNSKGCTSTLSLGKDGAVLNFHTFINWFKFASVKALHKVNDTIVVLGEDSTISPNKWNVYKTNFEGDSIDLIKFGVDPDVNAYTEAYQIKADYLYLLGRTFYPGKYDIIVLKIDKKGKKIKENRFYDIAKPKNSNTVFDMVKTTDGNFVLAGRFIRKHGHRNIQSFIIKFDENLDTIWTKKFNSVSLISNEPYLTALDDGSVVVSWGLYVPDMEDKFIEKHIIYEQYPSIIYNVDKDGNMVWSDTLWARFSKGFVGPKKRILKMITAKNGDIIGCGKYFDHTQRRYWGYMFRYSAEGKKLWEKRYEDIKYPSCNSIFFDLREAENGDIVCTGEMNTKVGWGNNNNYIWLLRVDSTGCYSQGCESIVPRRDTVQTISVDSDFTVGIEEPNNEFATNEKKIKIYPNPANDYIDIELENFKENNNISLKIYDILGNIKIVKDNYKAERINISILGKGMYFVDVYGEKGRIEVEKFVVE